MYGDVIGISYIIDPVLLGNDMLDEHKIRWNTLCLKQFLCLKNFLCWRSFLRVCYYRWE